MAMLTLFPTGTSFVSSAIVNSSLAVSAVIISGTSPIFANCISYLQFTIPPLPVVSVNSAKLRLYVITKTGAAPSPIVINRVASAFDIGTVTYNTQPPFVATASTSDVSLSNVLQFIEIDVTTLVNQWLNGTYVNNGIALTNTDGTTEVQFGGKDIVGSEYEPQLVLDYSEGPIGPASFVQLFDRNYTNELTSNTALNLSNEGINPLYTTSGYNLTTTTVTNDTLNLPGPGLYKIEVSLRASFLLPLSLPPFGSVYQILFNILNESDLSINSLVYNGIIPNDPNAVLDTPFTIQFLYNTAGAAPNLKIVLSNFDFSLAFENKLSVFDIILIVEKWENP